MFNIVIISLLFTRLPHKINAHRVCVPNTNFILNGRLLCFCDYKGRWSQANCRILARRQTCQPGRVFWQGCNKCTCSNSGELYCTNIYCNGNTTTKSVLSHKLSEYGERCIPFQSYHVNCSFCICPASGQSSDAKCSIDRHCFSNSQTMDIQTITKIKHCIPNTLYLFPCLQCPCSENGTFNIEKCVEKCQQKIKNEQSCISGKLYKNHCNVCQCPEDGIQNDTLCIKANCYNSSKPTFKFLRSDSSICVPRTFTKPRCLYCECLSNGTVNENSCLELDCSKTFNYKHSQSNECIPGDLVPICIECFCFNNGLTNETYCTRTCTYESKLNILENVFNHSLIDPNLIDKHKIKEIEQSNACEPNNIYFDNGRYCICPKNTDQESINKFCTPVIEHSKTLPYTIVSENKYNMTSNTSCEPNTLVDFDCNTCYCPKNGKIDPKWCTYDDCEAKRIILEMHKSNSSQNSIEDTNGFCTPGTISKVKCNFCICPESGILRERACTKNNCFENVELINGKFTCEPLTYYEVDCNICYCPHDGFKNVDKCTKNSCEKSFLRTDVCIPGQLFIDECKVCVCPRDGNKEDKVCTKNTCDIVPWNIYKLTHSLLENEFYDDTTRKLDLCFPGEEFVNGCDLCVCPELGLKTYATCERTLCENKSKGENISSDIYFRKSENVKSIKNDTIIQRSRSRGRRDVHDKCFVYNISQSAERKECTPGSMYIIRCRQCICPYVGNINNFCRPLPKTFHCEEAFPGFNYLSMGRRSPKNASNVFKGSHEEKKVNVTIKHLNHTIHKCDTLGKVTDECFICDCETGNIMIEEHCYKSDAEECINKKPTFISGNKDKN
ncbi:unnamed protein product [Euphydryas editha]|uniref:Pacifastin domain-containing protein n=1 Tax=Euphydryas editha TaxID=104508 RepID=A0AAU9UD62_EUPED|nr:unnamed protein product [Euphydryas editha]